VLKGQLSNKKKILILIDWFAPGYKAGGPIQSCVNLCAVLKTQYDVYVFTTDTDHGEEIPYRGIRSNEWITDTDKGIQVYYAQKKGLTLSRLKREVIHINPDFVYLNHLFSPRFVVYPIWLKLTGSIKGTMIVCPRGALYQSALNVKRYKKIPLLLVYKWLGIQRKVKFHATNQREAAAIAQYFPASQVSIADNLPNLQQQPFETCEKVAGSLKMIYVARIVAIKNLLFLLTLLPQLQEQIYLTVVGPVEDKEYWASCEQQISALPANIHVTCEGPVENSLLQKKIKAHHVYILPTTGENFGHSIFEALLAGRPVVISDQTPWLQLQQQNAGWDLPLNSPAQFVEAIKTMASCNQQQFDVYAKAAWKYAGDFIEQSVNKNPYSNIFS
jgi:glycosyltransferase involved in cell wall biosynthesis